MVASPLRLAGLFFLLSSIGCAQLVTTNNERPFVEPSGDLGSVASGGQLYIVPANMTDGYINIFDVGGSGATPDKAQLTAALADALAADQALSAEVTSMKTSLAAITSLLSKEFADSTFVIPGATPEAQLAALVEGIDALNHGQKQALYKALGGTR